MDGYQYAVSPLIALPEIAENEILKYTFALRADMPDSDGDGDNSLEELYYSLIGDSSDVVQGPQFHPSTNGAYEGNSWWCGSEEVGGYLDGWLQFLDTPEIIIPAEGENILTFDLFYAIELPGDYPPYDGWDAANVRISNNLSDSKNGFENYSITGYFAKKLVHYENIISLQGSTIKGYSFPIIRMADLYLNYAEALNETKESPDAEVYEYIQAVRHNAGLDLGGDILNTWAQYSNDPGKPNTKEGMREIIQNERMIELALEGYRYWDLRRWKLAEEYFSRPIRGCLLYTSPSPRDRTRSRMPSSA